MAAAAQPADPASGWEHFSHDADIGVRGFGPTVEAAFEQAARGMTAVITDTDKVLPERRVRIACDGLDPEQLLFDWLNAIVFEMATRRMLFGRFEVSFDGTHLRGAAWGEPVDAERHEPAAEVKGATYTDLKVVRDSAGHWIAQCVVDV